MVADALAGVPAAFSQVASPPGIDVVGLTPQAAAGAPAGLAAADAVLRSPDAAESATARGQSFADTLGRALDNLSGALSAADALAAGVAVNRAGVAQAAIARAKADTILEIAAIAAARVSGVITQLLQTQV